MMQNRPNGVSPERPMNPSTAEPYLPTNGIDGLENLAFDLAQEASELTGQLPPVIRGSVADLVRSVNCYYSNLIEGHDTHPRDIDRALAADFSTDPLRRDLQLEARAQIEVERMIDAGSSGFPQRPATRDFITWTHREFCARLPESRLVVTNPDTGEHLSVVPGELRTHDVSVGAHVPPPANDLPAFLERFEQAYDATRLTKARQVVAVAAAHHRFLWIHPFLDGNGRVAGLMSHAMLLELGVGSGLWSVSRGLARSVAEYKRLLMAADESDGRGALSHEALVEFCRFFLEACLDQVRYMRELFEPSELQHRMEHYVRDEEHAGRLPKRSYAILRETLLSGELERNQVPEVIGMSERTARRAVATLIDKRLLASDSQKAPLRLCFPIDVVERWFPRLYDG
jgi:Fic family protein